MSDARVQRLVTSGSLLVSLEGTVVQAVVWQQLMLNIVGQLGTRISEIILPVPKGGNVHKKVASETREVV